MTLGDLSPILGVTCTGDEFSECCGSDCWRLVILWSDVSPVSSGAFDRVIAGVCALESVRTPARVIVEFDCAALDVLPIFSQVSSSRSWISMAASEFSSCFVCEKVTVLIFSKGF